MKRIFCMLSLLLLLSFSAVSCGRYREEVLLGYQSYPMSVRGRLTYGEKEYAVSLQIPKAGDGIMTVALEGTDVTLSLSDGRVTAAVGELSLPITDGEYAAEQGILGAVKLFALSPDGFIGAEVKKEDGVSYTCASYRLPEGEAAVYFQKGIDTPERITAVLNGRSFSFRFVNE